MRTIAFILLAFPVNPSDPYLPMSLCPMLDMAPQVLLDEVVAESRRRYLLKPDETSAIEYPTEGLSRGMNAMGFINVMRHRWVGKPVGGDQ